MELIDSIRKVGLLHPIVVRVNGNEQFQAVCELASKLGRSHSYIIKRIMLLNLPQDIIDFINNRQLTPSTAEELFPIRDESKKSNLRN